MKECEGCSVENHFPLTSVETKIADDWQRICTVDSDEQREGFTTKPMKGRHPLLYTKLEYLCEFSQHGRQPRVLPVPVTTCYVANRLKEINQAAPDLVQSNPYGLCVFVSYNIDDERGFGERDYDFNTTSIAYYPQMLAHLAEGKNPKFCDTALLSILKKNGVDYRPTGLMSDMMPAVADELELLRDTTSGKHYRQLRWHRGSDHVSDRFEISEELAEENGCITCLKANPTYKWSECDHPTHKAREAGECMSPRWRC